MVVAATEPIITKKIVVICFKNSVNCVKTFYPRGGLERGFSSKKRYRENFSRLSEINGAATGNCDNCALIPPQKN